jgi:acetyl esterase/lipase
MIRFRCPKCDKRLGVKESQAGTIGACPECKHKFRIPGVPAEDEFTNSPPRKSAPKEEDERPAPAPRKRRRVDDEDRFSPEDDERPSPPLRKRRRVDDDEDRSSDDDEAERKPARKRKKKRRKKASGLPAWLDGFAIALVGLRLVGLLTSGIALIWPAASLLPLGLGGLVAMVGGLWFVVVAFQEDTVAGFLCLIVPFYSLYYLVTHFDDEKRPFFLQLVGTILVMMGSCAGALSERSGTASLEVGPEGQTIPLAEARQGFRTRLVRREFNREPAPEPPPQLFRTVRYDSPAGRLAAYVSPDPNDGKRHPAVIWITGGDCNSIDEGCWQEGPPGNDQSASAFRHAGIVMLFPSLRGGNGNPGVKEGFFGEVDDVLAAAEYLGQQFFVDPNRIYLGGHSTGGTLALLVAECSDGFRAVFSFGPVHDVALYGREYLPFDTSNRRELELRAPGHWLRSVRTPVFVLEGMAEGNVDSLQAMARTSTNAWVHFLPVRGAAHFSVLAPTTRLLADKILRDDGPVSNLALTEDEVNRLFAR